MVYSSNVMVYSSNVMKLRGMRREECKILQEYGGNDQEELNSEEISKWGNISWGKVVANGKRSAKPKAENTKGKMIWNRISHIKNKNKYLCASMLFYKLHAIFFIIYMVPDKKLCIVFLLISIALCRVILIWILV